MVLISVLLFFLSSGFLVWFFLKNDFSVREHTGALAAAAAFGFLGLCFAIWAELFLSFLTAPNMITGTVLDLFIAGMTIGIIEEIGKFVPLASFIKSKGYFNEHTDGVIYFGIAGLTFGLIENILYATVSRDQFATGDMTGIFRLVVLFFFHAASTGIVGYYFAKAKLRHQSEAKPIIALLVMGFVHGFYDFLLMFVAHKQAGSIFRPSAADETLIMISMVSAFIISALLNTFLFLYFRRARQWDASISMARQSAQNGGISTVPTIQPVMQPAYGQPLAPNQPLAAQPVHVQASQTTTIQH